MYKDCPILWLNSTTWDKILSLHSTCGHVLRTPVFEEVGSPVEVPGDELLQGVPHHVHVPRQGQDLVKLIVLKLF